MSKYEKVDFKELRKMMKERISISEVHEKYSGYVDRTGSMSRCPFCGKKKLYEVPTRDGFLCYNCNPSKMDIYGYYMRMFNVDFKQAQMYIARDFSFLSEETVERILKDVQKTSYIPVNQSLISKKPEIKEESNLVPCKPIKVINDVYEALSRLSPLTKKQYDYLKDKRNLSITRVLNDYFNMPYTYGDDGREFMDSLIKYLDEKLGYKEEDLIGVPGFYEKEDGRVMFKYNKGIGMKSRNAEGLISGIQMRRYDSISDDGELIMKNKESEKYKYLWLTSRRENKGSALGACIDVIIPDGSLYTSLFITEGKFKSEVIGKTFSSPVIATPGVSQWKNMGPEIEYISKNIRLIKNIYVCYDADMGTNLRVYKEFKEMTEKVLMSYDANINITIWDENFGKGLDDIILSGNKHKVKNVEFDDYCEMYEKLKSIIEAKYEIRNYTIYEKGTELEVSDDILSSMYAKHVLRPLGVETRN